MRSDAGRRYTRRCARTQRSFASGGSSRSRGMRVGEPARWSPTISAMGTLNPGRTSPPSSTSSAPSLNGVSSGRKTVTVWAAGSTSQTNRVPASRYTATLAKASAMRSGRGEHLDGEIGREAKDLLARLPLRCLLGRDECGVWDEDSSAIGKRAQSRHRRYTPARARPDVEVRQSANGRGCAGTARPMLAPFQRAPHRSVPSGPRAERSRTLRP